MGMYTEVVISTMLNDDREAIAILKYMIGEGKKPDTLPDHPLFKTPRWDFMLTCNSHYHVPCSINHLEYNKIAEEWIFVNRSDFKNYDSEVDHFFDWLMPYVAGDGFIGYSYFEEDWQPKLWFKGTENGEDE